MGRIEQIIDCMDRLLIDAASHGRVPEHLAVHEADWAEIVSRLQIDPSDEGATSYKGVPVQHSGPNDTYLVALWCGDGVATFEGGR